MKYEDDVVPIITVNKLSNPSEASSSKGNKSINSMKTLDPEVGSNLLTSAQNESKIKGKKHVSMRIKESVAML